MAENTLIQSPDMAVVAPPAVTRTPVAEASMSPLRLSDIMTPNGDETREDYGDSGHAEASAVITATAGWELHIPDPHPLPGLRLETMDRLRRDVGELEDQNRLLRQKLKLLQTNSSLKQAVLISTVISWFGDKGLFEEDPDTADRLTSMLLSSHSPAPGPSYKVDDVPWQITDDIMVSLVKAEDDFPNTVDRSNMDDDTSQWLGQSVDTSFNPPFSSSKKGMKTSPKTQEKETDEKSPVPAADFQEMHAFQHDGAQLRNKVDDGKTCPFNGSDDLDERLRRMENAIQAFGSRHAKTRAFVTRQRQNAVKRFRVWKAIAASRRLAAVDSGLVDGETLMESGAGKQSTTPTPLIQYPLERSDEEEVGSKCVAGDNYYPDQTILGEIAFQAERRILAFVFQRKEILYGYNLGNLGIMIRTHPEISARSALQRRYGLLMDVLRSYGWLKGRHPQFVAEVIARHGTLPDVETAKAEAVKRGWRNPSDLKRGVLCLCPVTEVLDMLVVLDCLLHMARNDGLPVFMW